MYRLPYILVFVVLTSCSSRKADNIHSFREYEEDGVTIAETSGGPKHKENLFTYEKVLTLAQNEEIEESLLFQPIHFLMDEEGRYYVLDYGNKRIAVFDQDGKYSHGIGREGQGPGEFQFPWLLSARDGYVTVLDSRLRRTSIFDYNGRFIKHITFSRARINTTSRTFEGPDDTKILL